MIERSTDGDVTVLRMAHGKASALDTELLHALAEAFEQPGDARALVLTGTGSIFSAGVDLVRLLDGGRPYISEFLPALSRTFLTLFTVPVPVVAAVNGHAIAGGCVMAAASDRKLMARGKGRVGAPELFVGVPFPLLALEILRFALPAHEVQQVLYTGAGFAPDEAQRRGLIDELVDAEELLPRAVAEAHRLAALPAVAFRLTKAELRRPLREAWERHGERSEREQLEAWSSPQVLAAVESYVAKTLKK